MRRSCTDEYLDRVPLLEHLPPQNDAEMRRKLSSQKIKNKQGDRTNIFDVGGLRLNDEMKLVHQKPLFWCSVIRECLKQTFEMKFISLLSLFVKDAVVVQ